MSDIDTVYVTVPPSHVKINAAYEEFEYTTNEQVAEHVQQLVTEALESFNTSKRSYVTIRHKGVAVKVPIEVSATLSSEKLSSELKKTHKIGAITWGANVHNILHAQQTDKPTFLEDYTNGQLLQLRSLGLLDNKNKVTDTGHAKLKELDERGPIHKRELNVLAKTILDALAYRSRGSGAVTKYMTEHKYIHDTLESDGWVSNAKILPKGLTFMEENVKRLQTMKSFKYYKSKLIRFLPLEELPKYLTSDKTKEREQAQLRYEDLLERGDI